jgi:hypothetical protein
MPRECHLDQVGRQRQAGLRRAATQRRIRARRPQQQLRFDAHRAAELDQAGDHLVRERQHGRHDDHPARRASQRR